MVEGAPAIAHHVFQRRAGEIEPAAIEPEGMPVRPGHPGKLRDVVRDGAGPSITRARGPLGPPPDAAGRATRRGGALFSAMARGRASPAARRLWPRITRSASQVRIAEAGMAT